ncbi:MAG: hypothetical protein ABSC18_13120 [Verrucomicrobiota bacterium]
MSRKGKVRLSLCGGCGEGVQPPAPARKAAARRGRIPGEADARFYGDAAGGK